MDSHYANVKKPSFPISTLGHSSNVKHLDERSTGVRSDDPSSHSSTSQRHLTSLKKEPTERSSETTIIDVSRAGHGSSPFRFINSKKRGNVGQGKIVRRGRGLQITGINNTVATPRYNAQLARTRSQRLAANTELTPISNPFSHSTPNEAVISRRRRLPSPSPVTTGKRQEYESDESSFFAPKEDQSSNSSLDLFTSIREWGLPDGMTAYYESKGIAQLFPWQVECLRKPGVLSGGNLVYSAPTSAGKTLVTDILMVKRVVEQKKKVLFIQPYNSVTREKMLSLTKMLKRTHIRVDGFYGVHTPPGGLLKTDIAVCTIEKANNLINRLIEEEMIDRIGMVVVDEIHLLGDPHRGYLLELMLSKLLYLCRHKEGTNIQIVGMSATIPNFNLVAQWLNATSYETDFRPIPLTEMVKIEDEVKELLTGAVKINVTPSSRPFPTLDDPDDIAYLAIQTVSEGQSVLIFEATRKMTEIRANNISKNICMLGNPENKNEIMEKLHTHLDSEKIKSVLESLASSPVKLDKSLESALMFGVAFHHAGLTSEEKSAVEDAFKDGTIKVLVATSTLAAGVNLPARRVIISSPCGPFSNPNNPRISTGSYKQMIGRAGRMGEDILGESILICRRKCPDDIRYAKEITTGEISPIDSCLLLGVRKSRDDQIVPSDMLNKALLEVIADKLIASEEEIADYIRCTFYHVLNGHQNPPLNEHTSASLQFLKEKGIISSTSKESANSSDGQKDAPSKLFALQLGSAINSSAISIHEGISMFESICHARNNFVLASDLHLIYEIVPSNLATATLQYAFKPVAFLTQLSDFISRLDPISVKVANVIDLCVERSLSRAMRNQITDMTSPELDKFRRFYMALALNDLVNEVPLGVVCNRYMLNKGAVQTLQNTSSSFAGMLATFCYKLGYHNMQILFQQFHGRLFHSVKYELLDLMRLPSITAEAARVLHKEGIVRVEDLAQSEIDRVEVCFKVSGPSHPQSSGSGNQPAGSTMSIKWLVGGQLEEKPSCERDVARILIDEARRLIQAELGVSIAAWKPASQDDPPAKVPTPHSSRLFNGSTRKTPNPLPASPLLASQRSTFLDHYSPELNLNGNKGSKMPSNRSYSQPAASLTRPAENSGATSTGFGESYNEIQEACLLEGEIAGNISYLESVESGRPADGSEGSSPRHIGTLKIFSQSPVPFVMHDSSMENDSHESDLEDYSKYADEEQANFVLTCGQPRNWPIFFKSPDISERRFTGSSNSSTSTPVIISESLSSDEEETGLFEEVPMTSPDVTFEPTDKIRVKFCGSKASISSLMKNVSKAKQLSLYLSFHSKPKEDTKKRASIGSRAARNSRREEKSDECPPFVPESLNCAMLALAGVHEIFVINDEEQLCDFQRNFVGSIQKGAEIIVCDVIRTIMAFRNSFGTTAEVVNSLNWFEPATALWLLDPEAPEIKTTVDRRLAKFLPTCVHLKDFIKRYSGFINQPDNQIKDSGIWTRAILTALLLPLRAELVRILREESMWKSFKSIEIPARLTIASMQLVGLGVDPVFLANLESRCFADRERAEKEAYRLAGKEFLITSPKQVADILYGHLKLHDKVTIAQESQSTQRKADEDDDEEEERPKAHSSSGKTPPKSRKGNYKTDRETLERLRAFHPIVDKIMFVRRMGAILSRGIFQIKEHVRKYPPPLDMCRVSGQSDPFTSTGRITMDNPNLLGVAKDFEETDGAGMEKYSLRRAFVAKKEHILISADYSQLELRVLSHLSGDCEMLSILRGGGDVFKSIAAGMRGKDPNDISDRERQHAKQICYGIIYGMGTRSLAARLEVTQDEAENFMKSFKKTYPSIEKFIKTTVEECRENGYVTTLLGRRRLLPNINSTHNEEKARAERQAVNTTIQGTASDLVKMAMNRVREAAGRRGLAGRLVLQIYDELMYEVPRDEVDSFAGLIQTEMEKCAEKTELQVGLPVRMKSGLMWGEMTPYNPKAAH